MFPEFESYVVEGGEGVVVNLRQFGRTIGNRARDLGERLQSTNFGKRVVEVGAETGKKLQQAKTFIVDKTEPMRNRFMKFVTSIKTGVIGQGSKNTNDDVAVKETEGVQIDVDVPLQQRQQQVEVKEEEQQKKEEEQKSSSNEHDDMVDMLLENINNQ